LKKTRLMRVARPGTSREKRPKAKNKQGMSKSTPEGDARKLGPMVLSVQPQRKKKKRRGGVELRKKKRSLENRRESGSGLKPPSVQARDIQKIGGNGVHTLGVFFYGPNRRKKRSQKQTWKEGTGGEVHKRPWVKNRGSGGAEEGGRKKGKAIARVPR